MNPKLPRLIFILLVFLQGCCEERWVIRQENKEAAAAFYDRLYIKMIGSGTTSTWAEEHATRATLEIYGEPAAQPVVIQMEKIK